MISRYRDFAFSLDFNLIYDHWLISFLHAIFCTSVLFGYLICYFTFCTVIISLFSVSTSSTCQVPTILAASLKKASVTWWTKILTLFGPQAKSGVSDDVLESYCWMYAHFKIPKEYKGPCSGTEQVKSLPFQKCKLSAKGAGATFDWLFFDNSKLIDFDC